MHEPRRAIGRKGLSTVHRSSPRRPGQTALKVNGLWKPERVNPVGHWGGEAKWGGKRAVLRQYRRYEPDGIPPLWGNTDERGYPRMNTDGRPGREATVIFDF